MTQPNLDALAKLAPFESTRNCVWPRDHDVPSIGLRDIAAALNEWAELRTYRERMTWQPIDTAPTDGTEVLLIVTEAEGPYRVIGSHDMGRWFAHGCGAVEPTHWAMLPDLPGQGATDGR